MSFHWQDGWIFTRYEDGSVEVSNENFRDDRLPESQPGIVSIVIPPNEWASIVASVSKGGETGESYHGTLAFHMGDASSQPHKVMTPEEYAAMSLKGWHEVCRDIDHAGNVGVRFVP